MSTPFAIITELKQDADEMRGALATAPPLNQEWIENAIQTVEDTIERLSVEC